MAQLKELCEKLAQEWQFEGNFSAGVAGLYAIPLAEMELLLTETDEGFNITTELLRLPEKKRVNLMRDALLSNFLLEETRGATLALDEQEKLLVRFAWRHGKPAYRDFLATIEDFISTADSWYDYLLESRSSG